MLWFDRIRLDLRRGWDRVDATLVDSRFVELKLYSSDGAGGSFQIWEYMVDVPGPSGGAPVRLTFKEKTFIVRGAPGRRSGGRQRQTDEGDVRPERSADRRRGLGPGAAAASQAARRRAVRLATVGEVLASVDEYGVVRADVPLGGNCALFLQAGDGWDRVIWTARSGRVHEWTWNATETPDDVGALLDGKGVERTTLLGRRRVEVALIIRDRVVATSGGWWRRSLRRIVRSSERVEPAL